MCLIILETQIKHNYSLTLCLAKSQVFGGDVKYEVRH